MDSLSARILRSQSLDEIDSLLEAAFIGFELVGELDISKEAFEKISAKLRSTCLRIDPKTPLRILRRSLLMPERSAELN